MRIENRSFVHSFTCSRDVNVDDGFWHTNTLTPSSHACSSSLLRFALFFPFFCVQIGERVFVCPGIIYVYVYNVCITFVNWACVSIRRVLASCIRVVVVVSHSIDHVVVIAVSKPNQNIMHVIQAFLPTKWKKQLRYVCEMLIGLTTTNDANNSSGMTYSCDARMKKGVLNI